MSNYVLESQATGKFKLFSKKINTDTKNGSPSKEVTTKIKQKYKNKTFVKDGFWSSITYLVQNDHKILSFQKKWNGNFEIKYFHDNIQETYKLKDVGFINRRYVLTDEAGDELLTTRCVRNKESGILKKQYKMYGTDEFENLYNKEDLLLTVVECVHYNLSLELLS